MQAVVERKLNQALEKAVDQAEIPVSDLLSAIENDIEIAYERRRAQLSQRRKIRIDAYNHEISHNDPDQERVKKLADLIREHEESWEVFAAANPSTGLKAMRTAHLALVEYAKGRDKRTSLVEFAEAMDIFAARANQVGLAVRAAFR